jgi:hypothetical protein
VRDGGAGGTASEDLWYSYDDEIQRNMIVNIYLRWRFDMLYVGGVRYAGGMGYARNVLRKRGGVDGQARQDGGVMGKDDVCKKEKVDGQGR